MSDIAQMIKIRNVYILICSSLEGMEQVYVHVHRSNKSAQELYQKMGLEVMWMHLFLLYFWFQFLAFYF